jgi:sister chromatid cohesion protein DCC1
MVPLLNMTLTLVTIHATLMELKGSPPICKSPSQPIIAALEEDHDVPSHITTGVMSLFGAVDSRGEWTCEVLGLVRELGRGLLEGLEPEGVGLYVFMDDWKNEVGESFAELVDVKLLVVGFA